MILIIIILTALYAFAYYAWDGFMIKKFSYNVSKWLSRVHFMGLLVSLAVMGAYVRWEIGLNGFWTSRLFIITTLLTGFLLCFMGHKTAYSQWAHRYFRWLGFAPILTGLVSLVPFLGLVLVGSCAGHLFYPVEKVYYQDAHWNVYSGFSGVLAPPHLKIYERKGFYEKKWYDKESFADSIQVKYNGDLIPFILRYEGQYRDTIFLK